MFGILSNVRSRSWSDDQLRDAVATSHNLFQVGTALRISPGARTYALLRRHIDRLGIDAAHLPTVERRRTIRAWSDDEWMGRELPLALDHVNGDPTDNRLENLRILCPNCHALTDTWCARNR